MSCGHTAIKEPSASSPGTNFASVDGSGRCIGRTETPMEYLIACGSRLPGAFIHATVGVSIEASKLDQMHAGTDVSPRSGKQ